LRSAGICARQRQQIADNAAQPLRFAPDRLKGRHISRGIARLPQRDLGAGAENRDRGA
jgi:hypothetical protein